MRVIIWFLALVGFGALISWVATDWPDTLSGLFFLGLILAFVAFLCRHGGYRGGNGGSYQRTDVHVHIDNRRNP